MSKTVVLIPSRLSATRLPRKPLLKINGLSIISNVFKKAKEADIGEVYVATEDKEILDDVQLNGGKAILTSNKHKTGSDRIYECYERLDLKNIEVVKLLISELEIKNYQNLNRKGKFSNKNIMFTGGFKKISRSEAKLLTEENGGKVLGTISKKLNILVVGDSKPTKKKIDKAKELKIDIINEQQWYKILNI